MASQQHTPSAPRLAQLDAFSDVERWKPIPGFEGFYEASSKGNIRSLTRHYVTKRNRHVSVQGRGLVPCSTSKTRPENLYYAVALCKGGVVVRRPIHRLVLETFIGPRPEGHVCNHIDGDRLNNVLENLEWVTWQRNAEDSVERGTKFLMQGEAQHNSRFTVADILEMRSLATTGMSYGKIAKMFTASTSTVSRIVKRQAWKHIP